MESLPKSWRRGFDTAAAAAEYSNGRRQGEKMGAALYSGPILVSVGFNIYNKTNPNSTQYKNEDGSEFSSNIHAEMAALTKRKYYDDRNLTMYIYRSKLLGTVNKYTKHHACSKPCKNCYSLLKFAGVRTVRFIDEQGNPAEMKITKEK